MWRIRKNMHLYAFIQMHWTGKYVFSTFVFTIFLFYLHITDKFRGNGSLQAQKVYQKASYILKAEISAFWEIVYHTWFLRAIIKPKDSYLKIVINNIFLHNLQFFCIFLKTNISYSFILDLSGINYLIHCWHFK